MGLTADFVLVVLAGLLGGLAARALRIPLLVGYVAAGILVGPHTAGPKVVQLEDIERLAEIGVALLLFALGLELSFRDLQPVRRIALFGGACQILLTTAAGSFAASRWLGMPTAEAIWFGSMLSVSSTAVVLKTLSAGGVTSTLASRVMIGLLVVQDLAVVPMLVILPQLGDMGNFAAKLARAIGIAAVLLAAIVVLGTWLLPKLLRLVLAWGSRELFLVSVVAIGIGVGYATEHAGLSFPLGAFVAGLVLAESEFSHQALNEVVPLRDIFGLLFFVTVGMLLDPAYALSHATQLIAVVLLTFACKAIITGGITRAFGYVNMAPWLAGLGLAQIGEFSFVLARAGVVSGMISKSTYDLALSATVLSMAMSPLASGLALPLGRAWQKLTGRPNAGPAASPVQATPVADALRDHVIVAGYGRTGRAAARVLQNAGIPLLVVELNHLIFNGLAAEGIEGLWGDITSEHTLTATHIEQARVLLLTLPDKNAMLLASEKVLKMNPGLAIIARAGRPSHAEALQRLGMKAAIQPEFEGGVEMVRRALEEYPCDQNTISRLVTDVRTEFYRINPQGS